MEQATVLESKERVVDQEAINLEAKSPSNEKTCSSTETTPQASNTSKTTPNKKNRGGKQRKGFEATENSLLSKGASKSTNHQSKSRAQGRNNTNDACTSSSRSYQAKSKVISSNQERSDLIEVK